ncbi:PBP1A family penicillin-binding protein [Turicibacter sanguinis]|nr:PBP1A family penicillin-binding protein [Turicibacter sanguinis]MTN49912.1 PBP1A family penicillin-binding protein [Turicibacter sanguinis]MTN52943.1 PBP1A family penicillin-binding protein [Turicibacter sanguinis]MTN56193.1 PBP1A family penicillin-binding protein [Turicibacter sanguinis]MTN59257.1 PBP1A family penicillin-binding protein [Turicibacter sanguinis]
MNKNKGAQKFSLTLFQSVGTILKGFLLVVLLGGIAAMMIGGFIIFKTIETAPELDISKIYATESSYIYDKDGNVIDELGVQKREWVTYDQISPVLIDAIVSVEDSKFFEHHGVDWQRFLVALITNLKSGDFDQGASTLTQQLIKQSHLTSEKSIDRKIKEIYLSIQIEKVLTKEQIIEAYLNFSPFGGSVNGIQKASEYYFGKDASDLTLSEAATLAGIVQLPNVYRPDTNPDASETRRNTVLKLMVKHGYITEDMATLAAAKPITDMLAYQTSGVDDKTKYQSFIDVVINEVQEKYGLDPYSGLQIYTTMDPYAQAFVYDLQNTNQYYTWPQDLQSGIIFMDTKTGEIRAIGGGSAEGERTFNLATQIQRQPGSTAKPIFAYGPAIEYLGWGSGTTINDDHYAYQNGSDVMVHNYNHMYQGRMTIRNALNKSLNVPAVKAFNAVGDKKVAEFAQGLGMPVEDTLNESTAIGGVETGFSPLDMAGAYAAFGNGGTYNEPITIEKIVLSDGTTIYADQKSETAMSPETAYIITDMLHTVMTDGTGKTANVTSMYLSGKTGTTNFPQEIREKYGMPDNAIRDSWFVGYSSEYTAAIWTGYTDTSQGHYISNSEQSAPWYVFKNLMSYLNPAGYVEPTRPDSVVSVTIEKESGAEDGQVQLASSLTPDAYKASELFPKGSQPSIYSTRFEQLATPQNLTGSYNGSQLQLSWEHIKTYTLDYNYINSLISQYKSITPNCTKLSSCKELEVPEDQLYMMKFQLDTIGGTVYDVYAKDMDGNEVHLGTTSDNSFTKDLGYGEMSYYTDFYIRARYENYGALASNNSNSITVDCENCFKPVSIPDMAGWTKAQAESWGSSNGINISFSDEPSTTVAEGIIISNSPNSGTLTPGSTVYVKVATSQLVVPNYQSDSDFINKYQAWGTLNSISIKVNQENHETIASGGFIGSNPGIGSAITPGSTLTITVSKGPASTTPETPETPVIPDPINPDSGVNGDGDDDERATPVGAQTISFIRTLFNFFN